MIDEISLVSEVEGYYTLEILKTDGNGDAIESSARSPVPTFKNLITNAGLDRMGSFTDHTRYCQVGSGSTPPTVNDGNLAAFIASKSVSTTTNTAQAVPPYYAAGVSTYEFAAGTATGNLSEVGVGWAQASGSLFSRALILDGNGSPTTITVLPDEILRVTYQLRYFAPTSDNSGTLSLNGVNVNWVSRASQATISTSWKNPLTTSAELNSGSTAYQVAYDGAVNPDVTQSPSGTTSFRDSISDAAYSAGSHARSGTVTWGLSNANFAGGIKAVKVQHGIGCYQVGFTPPVMKDASQILTLTFSHSWARKAL